MNYFAHGYRFVDRPYFLAGTAVPDWLNVANRKAKARAKTAEQFVADEDQRLAEVAMGILQHHHDDAWFHVSRPFAELSMSFAVEIRELLGSERGFRAGFLGHILVEILLDACLIEDDSGKLDEYYDAFESIDAQWLGIVIDRLTTQPVPRLGEWIPRFCQEGFLYDYLSDDRLLWRLNHVMKRVKLAELPASLQAFFPDARRRVRENMQALLTEPDSNHGSIDEHRD